LKIEIVSKELYDWKYFCKYFACTAWRAKIFPNDRAGFLKFVFSDFEIYFSFLKLKFCFWKLKFCFFAWNFYEILFLKLKFCFWKLKFYFFCVKFIEILFFLCEKYFFSWKFLKICENWPKNVKSLKFCEMNWFYFWILWHNIESCRNWRSWKSELRNWKSKFWPNSCRNLTPFVNTRPELGIY